jgi:lysophospholipase L1-like esterase
MKQYLKLGIALATISATACKPSINKETPNKGAADFTTYVAIGNSLCAGYTDGGLSREGQENSFPRMLAQQFALVGGGSLNTPFMSATGNGNNGSNQPVYSLVYDSVSKSPTPKQIGTATPINDNATIAPAGPYRHLGVPGARAVDATFNGYGGFNPFFGRMISTPTNSILDEAMRTNATFFSLWLGSNDVLLWAINGGDGPEQSAPGFAFPQTLVHPGGVQASIQRMVDSLTKNGAKGVLANVPDVQSTPYFTTVPYNAVVLTRQGQADSLNAAYTFYNTILPANEKIVWAVGSNPLIITDSTIPTIFQRKARPSDLICLSALPLFSQGFGTMNPLADKYVLDGAEVALAQSYTAQYNTGIKSIADAKGLALFDANTFLKGFKNGLVYNGVSMNATFVTGGGFSLDGIHPTPRGYALIANEFIKVINAKYGSTIPQVDANKYRANNLP